MKAFIEWLIYNDKGPNNAYNLCGRRYIIYKTRKEAKQNAYADFKVKKVVIKDPSNKEGK